MKRRTKMLRLTIAERFPVFYKPGKPDNAGPYYAPGAEFWHVYTAAKLAWLNQCATALRNDGYTATVEIVER